MHRRVSSVSIAIFVDIGGERYDIGEADLFDPAEMAATLAEKVVEILTAAPWGGHAGYVGGARGDET